MFRIIILLFFVPLLSAAGFGQAMKCDTIVDGDTCNWAHYYANGSLKHHSSSRTKKVGLWINYDKGGRETSRGKYDARKKRHGKWWYRRAEFTIYDHGIVIKKGKGCIGCSTF